MSDAPRVIRLVTDDDLPPADQATLTRALLDWQADDVEYPLIPVDYDADGDGTTDAFGLDPEGRLAYVASVPIAETVYESTGDGGERG